MSLKLGKPFFFFLLLWAISKHKNDLGHLKETSNWAKNWISCITFHKEWEYQLKVGIFKLLAHTYRPWATLLHSFVFHGKMKQDCEKIGLSFFYQALLENENRTMTLQLQEIKMESFSAVKITLLLEKRLILKYPT